MKDTTYPYGGYKLKNGYLWLGIIGYTLTIFILGGAADEGITSLNNPPNIQSHHSGWMSVKPIEVNVSELNQSDKPKLVSFNDIKIGDIIATGKRSSPKEPCQVSFGIAHEFANGERGSKHVTTKVDENCNVIVVEKDENLHSSNNSTLHTPLLDKQDRFFSKLLVFLKTPLSIFTTVFTAIRFSLGTLQY